MDQKPNLPEQINLMPVIQWLEAGCDPKHAAAELRIYAERLAAAALSAAPAQEPVAWAVFADSGNVRLWAKDSKQVREFAASIGKRLVPLYASPLPQEPQEGKAGEDHHD